MSSEPKQQKIADEDFALASAATELLPTESQNLDVEQSDGVLGVVVDSTDAQPIVERIDWSSVENQYTSLDKLTAGQYWVIPQFVIAWKKIVACLLLVLACVSVLFAVSQTATLISSIQVLPLPFRVLCYVALILLWLALCIALTQGILTIARLQRSPKISLATLDALHQRGMNSQRSATRSVIRNFLRDYPKTKEQISLLGAGGIGSSGSAISAQDFFNRIDQVLSNDEVNIGQWLKSVNSGVIQPLDSAADRLILSSAIKVGVKTAISPRGVIDSLIVLTHSWLLIRNLCRLYNLRPNGWEICIIFGFSGFNALVSDKGDDAASSIQKEIADNGANYVSGLAANALGLLTSRAAEGSVNGLLIHRLGYQVKKYIRPISS